MRRTREILIMTIREICQKYGLADTTLRDWIDFGVVGEPGDIEKEKRRGRLTQVLNEAQLERLDKFLKYREWLVASGEDAGRIDAVIGLLEAIAEEDYDGAIKILQDTESTLTGILDALRDEIAELIDKRDENN